MALNGKVVASHVIECGGVQRFISASYDTETKWVVEEGEKVPVIVNVRENGTTDVKCTYLCKEKALDKGSLYKKCTQPSDKDDFTACPFAKLD